MMAGTMNLTWESPMADFNAARKSLGLKSRCSCSFGDDCKKAQVLFALQEDDPRGKPCIELKLNGDSAKMKKWRDLVMINLGRDTPFKNEYRVPVARHHWTVAQLRHFDSNDAKPSTTCLSKGDTDEISHFTDPRASFTDMKGTVLYFQAPNNPRSNWKTDASSLSGARQARREQRVVSVEKAKRKEQRKIRKEELKQERKQTRDQIEEDKQKSVRQWRQQVADLDREAAGQERQLRNEVENRDAIIEQKDDEISTLQTSIEDYKKEARNLRRQLERLQDNNAPAPALGGRDDSNHTLTISSMIGQTTELTVKWGGVSRLTLSSKSWHDAHPEATNVLFGFHSWKEMTLYIEDLFPDVDTQFHGKITLNRESKHLVVAPTNLTPFERCVACKMFFHSLPHRLRVAVIFGVSHDVIGNAVREWGPRWGKGGEQLSILIITPWYLRKERPEDYMEYDFDNVGALTDAKDFVTETKRSDGTLQRMQQSSKVKNAAGRCLTYSTPAGLSFENSAMLAGRVQENNIVRIYGSIGKKKAPLEDWKDYAKGIKNKNDYYKLKLSSALDSVDYDDFEVGVVGVASNAGDDSDSYKLGQSDDSSSSDADGAASSSGCVVVESSTSESVSSGSSSAKDEDLQFHSQSASDSDDSHSDLDSPPNSNLHPQSALDSSERNDNSQKGSVFGSPVSERSSSSPSWMTTSPPAPRKGSAGKRRRERKARNRAKQRRKKKQQASGGGGSCRVGSLTAQVDQDFELRVKEAQKAAAAATMPGSGNKKRKRSIMIDDADTLMEEIMEHVRSGPHSSALEMLCQLETHERLHRHYESGDLRKCMLSYYLMMMKDDRMRILHHLGSSMVPESYNPGEEPLPEVWLRLAKIPEGFDILADKGFDKTEGLYPWWNLVWCPIVLRDRNIKQTLNEEIVGSKGHQGIKRLRYSIEAGYSRITDQECVKDTIPYRNLSQLQNMLAWGHAMVNLGMPFRRPGYSPRGYWDDCR